MNLVNIYNDKRKVYLFLRDQYGKLKIESDNTFFPYFYIKDETGNFKSYLGDNLKKLISSDPSTIKLAKNSDSFEGDIKFTKRYLLDRIKEIHKTKIKYAFIDIETLSKELPDANKAKHPISCISVSNSYTNTIKTWYLGEYKTEQAMLSDFVNYMSQEKFDLLLGWNIYNFDYPYLFNRIKGFANKISPINKTRYWRDRTPFPVGISIIDYLTWYKILIKGLSSYSLDSVFEHEFNVGKKYNPDFSKLSEDIKLRNIEDVAGMIKIEEKHGIIEYYDEIRRMAKVEWEDLIYNSRTIDMLVLQEARNKKIVLPMRPDGNEEKDEFEGAYREALKTGAMYDIGKYDLSGAYLYTIIDFCLDTSNLREVECENSIKVNVTDRISKDITSSYYMIQNEKAILPTVVKKLTINKNTYKEIYNSTPKNSPEYQSIKKKYEAIKGVTLSSWGVIGNQHFRLYDSRIASTITSIVRSLLHYIRDNLKKRGINVVYIDTDSVFCEDSGKNIVDLLNSLVNEWSITNFKKKTSISFDYEGHFEKILILAKCRYLGYLNTINGIEEEIKGVETKRVDSSKFMKKFQKELIDKILNKDSKEQIMLWLKNQKEAIKNMDLKEIAFPCRLSKKITNYNKNTPIFVRALENTPNFNAIVGDKFYYIFIEPTEYQTKEVEVMYIRGKKLTPKLLISDWSKYYNEEINVKNMDSVKYDKLVDVLKNNNTIITKKEIATDKPKDVIAFSDTQYQHIKDYKIDWNKIIERNIDNKSNIIFNAMNWVDCISTKKPSLKIKTTTNQMSLL